MQLAALRCRTSTPISYAVTLLHPSPGLKAERASFPEVSKALEKVALEKGLQLHGPWLNKCIQLYETYLVRHGIMLVRPGARWRASVIEN